MSPANAESSETLTLMIQPVPYGSWLRDSRLSGSDVFTWMISPDTGAVQGADGLDRFNFAEFTPCGDDCPGGGQFHVHQVGQLLDGKRRDADCGDLVPALLRHMHPFVGFAVQQFLGSHLAILI